MSVTIPRMPVIQARMMVKNCRNSAMKLLTYTPVAALTTVSMAANFPGGEALS